jgi:hypothetical protein
MSCTMVNFQSTPDQEGLCSNPLLELLAAPAKVVIPRYFRLIGTDKADCSSIARLLGCRPDNLRDKPKISRQLLMGS